jgi:hypothetical protein
VIIALLTIGLIAAFVWIALLFVEFGQDPDDDGGGGGSPG